MWLPELIDVSLKLHEGKGRKRVRRCSQECIRVPNHSFQKWHNISDMKFIPNSSFVAH